MANRAPDEVDAACLEWAKGRRKQLNLDDPRMERAASREFIGAVRSTLGQRRDLHAGATTTRADVHCPEGFYEGTALVVQRAYRRMRPFARAVLETQYVFKAPATVKAELLAMDVVTYYRHLNHVKGIVLGWLMQSDSFDNYGVG